MKKCPYCHNILTPLTAWIFNYCKSKIEIRVKDIVKKFNISETSANNYFRTLWIAGLLRRESENIISGGLRYVYYLTKKGRNG